MGGLVGVVCEVGEMERVPGCDLAAVGAVADEGIYQAIAFCRHFYLDSAAVAGGRCCAIALAVGAFGWEVDLL